jgi:hypothetical protein
MAEKAKKTAVFLDLDGTLWDHEVIPESAMEAIAKAQKNGHYIFANTGRARASAAPLLEHLPLDGFVYSAGSEIWFHGQRIYFDPFDEKTARKLIKDLMALDIGLTVECSNNTFNSLANRLYFQTRKKPVSDIFLKTPLIKEMKDSDYQDIMKFSANFAPAEDLNPVLDAYNVHLTPFNMEGREVDTSLLYGEITKKDNTKGTAVNKVKECLHEDMHTMAAGDSENDIPMLEAADIAVVMGNGTARTKEFADFITTDINENGLYNAFEKAGLF